MVIRFCPSTNTLSSVSHRGLRPSIVILFLFRKTLGIRRGIASSRPPPPLLTTRPFSEGSGGVGQPQTLSHRFLLSTRSSFSVLPHETNSSPSLALMSLSYARISSSGESPCVPPARRLHPPPRRACSSLPPTQILPVQPDPLSFSLSWAKLRRFGIVSVGEVMQTAKKGTACCHRRHSCCRRWAELLPWELAGAFGGWQSCFHWSLPVLSVVGGVAAIVARRCFRQWAELLPL
jgi:hypothetical protein